MADLDASRRHLLAQASRRIEQGRWGGMVPIQDVKRLLADFIEHALGEGYAAGRLDQDADG